jgi:HAMP domain-containing protein
MADSILDTIPQPYKGGDRERESRRMAEAGRANALRGAGEVAGKLAPQMQEQQQRQQAAAGVPDWRDPAFQASPETQGKGFYGQPGSGPLAPPAQQGAKAYQSPLDYFPLAAGFAPGSSDGATTNQTPQGQDRKAMEQQLQGRADKALAQHWADRNRDEAEVVQRASPEAIDAAAKLHVQPGHAVQFNLPGAEAGASRFADLRGNDAQGKPNTEMPAAIPHPSSAGSGPLAGPVKPEVKINQTPLDAVQAKPAAANQMVIQNGVNKAASSTPNAPMSKEAINGILSGTQYAQGAPIFMPTWQEHLKNYNLGGTLYPTMKDAAVQDWQQMLSGQGENRQAGLGVGQLGIEGGKLGVEKGKLALQKDIFEDSKSQESSDQKRLQEMEAQDVAAGKPRWSDATRNLNAIGLQKAREAVKLAKGPANEQGKGQGKIPGSSIPAPEAPAGHDKALESALAQAGAPDPRERAQFVSQQFDSKDPVKAMAAYHAQYGSQDAQKHMPAILKYMESMHNRDEILKSITPYGGASTDGKRHAVPTIRERLSLPAIFPETDSAKAKQAMRGHYIQTGDLHLPPGW